MKFYKVLQQKNQNKPPLTSFDFFQFEYNKEVIQGGKKFSLAIEYTPNDYYDMLQDNHIFSIYLEKNISQVIMNNFKFIHLINFTENLGIHISDIKFDNIPELDDNFSFDPDSIREFLISYDLQISQITFLSLRHEMITVKSNGVVGFDEELIEDNAPLTRSMIDFLNYGSIKS